MGLFGNEVYTEEEYKAEIGQFVGLLEADGYKRWWLGACPGVWYLIEWIIVGFVPVLGVCSVWVLGSFAWPCLKAEDVYRKKDVVAWTPGWFGGGSYRKRSDLRSVRAGHYGAALLQSLLWIALIGVQILWRWAALYYFAYDL